MSNTDKRLGIRELRQNASRYLEQVERGSTFEITRRGEPVARLVPVRPAAGRVSELVADGVLLPPEETGDLLDVLPAPPVDADSRGVSDELQRMRDEERW